MSKNINVNPGQYKVAGRERQGEDIVHERQKAVEAKLNQRSRNQRRQTQKKKQPRAGK
jgi:hypothetical protein